MPPAKRSPAKKDGAPPKAPLSLNAAAAAEHTPTARLGGDTAGKGDSNRGQDSKRGAKGKGGKPQGKPRLAATAEEPASAPQQAAPQQAAKVVMTAQGTQKKIEYYTEELLYAHLRTADSPPSPSSRLILGCSQPQLVSCGARRLADPHLCCARV